MTGYSVKSRAFGALWAVLFCLAAIAPAPAQETGPRSPRADAPRSLVPPKPAQLPAGAGLPTPAMPKPVSRGAPLKGGSDQGQPIKVGELKAIDPESVGLLDDASAGFGIDMWNGTA